MIRPSWLWGLGLLLLFGCAQPELSCDDELGCFQLSANAPLVIAILGPAENEAAFLGEDMMLGVRLAVETAASELLDHPIETIFVNSDCSEAGGRAAAQDILAQGEVVGVIGPACAAAAAGSLPILSRTNLTILSPAVTHPDLTNANANSPLRWRAGFYRLVPNFTQQAETAALYAFEQPSMETAVIIHDDSPHMAQLAATFNNALNRRSNIETTTYIWSGSNAEAVLDTITLAPPDLLYVALYAPSASPLLTGLGERFSLEPVQIIGNDTLIQQPFAVEMRNLNTAVYATGPYLANHALYLEWTSLWQEQLANQSRINSVAYAYDSTQLLLQAIQEAAQVDVDGSLLIGQATLRLAIEQKQRSGITGSLRCNGTGECADPTSLALFRINAATEWPPPVVWQPTP